MEKFFIAYLLLLERVSQFCQLLVLIVFLYINTAGAVQAATMSDAYFQRRPIHAFTSSEH